MKSMDSAFLLPIRKASSPLLPETVRAPEHVVEAWPSWGVGAFQGAKAWQDVLLCVVLAVCTILTIET